MHATCATNCPPPGTALPAPWPPSASPTSGGAAAVEYTARTNTTAAADPSDGNVVWNTAAEGNATRLFISAKSSGKADTSHLWSNVRAGRSLTIQRKSNGEVIARYTVNDVVDNGGWFTVNVTPGSNSGLPFANNDALIVTISAAPIP